MHLPESPQPPFGKGGMFRDLISSGYDGGLSIEPHLAAVAHLAKEASDPEQAYKLYLEYGRKLVALVHGLGGA